jgi:PAS domain S-box-containing protein
LKQHIGKATVTASPTQGQTLQNEFPMHKTVDPLFRGPGEVASLMRTHDWSTSPLDTPDRWPQALRTVVNLILNSKFPMFVAWGPELGFLYNDAYAEILGTKHPSAVGRPFHDIWSEIWSDISPIIDKAMAGEASYFENLPLTMFRKGYEEQTWFTFSYSPVHDESGKVAGMYCACTETTQQVLAERHRVNENERLRQLFQQAPGLMVVTRGSNHTLELFNDAYRQLVGDRELMGKSVREALPEIEGQGFFELLDNVYTSGQPFIGRALPIKLQRQQGRDLEERFVDFIYQPILDRLGNVTGIFTQGNDVTEAVHATQALRESEQRLRQLANTIPHLAWMANPDGWVHWFNDRWYEYTGTAPEKMEGWGWREVPHPEHLPGIVDEWKKSVASGVPFERVFPMRSASGEYRTFFTRAAPLRDAAGTIVQWFGTNTDIHDIERTQEELRAANHRKDEFLAMLAHELRNPLAPINAAAELLKLAELDPEHIRLTSDIVIRQVAHMTELVDDLLDVSRVTRNLINLQLEQLDLKKVVADAVEQVSPLIEKKEQQLDVTFPAETIFVNGDSTRLTQIFSNILNNAAKYTPERGRITLWLDRQDDKVEVCVQDNGVGIDVELLPYVFELFTQGKRSPDRSQGGLGLGLTLVKSLAELHGGTVTADSQGRNKGSKFTVTLHTQAQPEEPGQHEADPELTDVESHGRLVLVVDDNVDAAQTLGALLETQGHRTLLQYNATDALKQVAEQMPQVMILDIGLPDIDGYELARRIRAMPGAERSTLVALTGYGQSQDKETSRAAGFSYHLIKPVNAQSLFKILAELDMDRGADAGLEQ